jgi:hypothetical protein
MPAFLICMAHLDLFSGLNRGQLGCGRKPIQIFLDTYSDAPSYSLENVTILYEGFRHHIAHCGGPSVPIAKFDKRMAWRLHDKRRGTHSALELVRESLPVKKNRRVYPWPIEMDHRFEICLRTLHKDILKAVRRYANALRDDALVRERFDRAIQAYFP